MRHYGRIGALTGMLALFSASIPEQDADTIADVRCVIVAMRMSATPVQISVRHLNCTKSDSVTRLLQLGAYPEIEGAAVQRCPNIRNRVTAGTGRRSNQRVKARLTHVGQIDRIYED
jgi:hypothetical protein